MKYKLDKKKYGVHSQVLQCVKESSFVLEIGTAQGYLTSLLKEKGCLVDGIEIDKESASQAAAFCRTIFTADAETFDYGQLANIHYDIVLALDVVEHMKDPDAFLKRLETLKGAHTKFYFSVPNVANYVVRIKLFFGDFTYTERGILDKTHLRFFTYKTFLRLLVENRFEVKKLFSIPQLPFSMVGLFGYWITKIRPTLMSSHVACLCEASLLRK